MNLRDLHPKRFFIDGWREIDREAIDYRAKSAKTGRGDSFLAVYIFVVVAICLILLKYLGKGSVFFEMVHFIDHPDSAQTDPFLFSLVGWLRPETTTLYEYITQGGYKELWRLGYWASWRVLGYFVIPLIAIALHPRLRKAPMGLSFKGMGRHIWIYVVLFIPVLVAVFAVSFMKEFSSYYPFYDNAYRSLFDFLVWETFYMAQFLSLEFFYRGFMIQPLKRSMGSSAIFAMMIPYVMVHFGKPMLECFGAIIAGIVLGTLAIRTRSIWSGFLIHASVAVSMDVLAIWQVHW